MPSVDDADAEPLPDPLDQLRHDLKTPLTAISGRTQLLARAVRRSPSISDKERSRMLEELATIEVAVRAMVTIIDAMSAEEVGRFPDSPE